MAVDWLVIRNDYINGGGSYRKLAEKYGVSFNTLKDRAVAEQWSQQKTQQHNRVVFETQQKTAEKISDALSDEAAAKVRLRAKAMQLCADWFEKVEEIADTNEFRRMVQCLADMGVFEKDVSEYTQGTQNEDDPLTKSLKEEAERLNNADIE